MIKFNVAQFVFSTNGLKFFYVLIMNKNAFFDVVNKSSHTKKKHHIYTLQYFIRNHQQTYVDAMNSRRWLSPWHFNIVLSNTPHFVCSCYEHLTWFLFLNFKQSNSTNEKYLLHWNNGNQIRLEVRAANATRLKPHLIYLWWQKKNLRTRCVIEVLI